MTKDAGRGRVARLLAGLRRSTPARLKASDLIRAGNAANRDRRWREAEQAYAAALAARPDRPGVLVQYGHALKEQGFLHQATAAYLRAVRLDPANADTHLQIGHVMHLQGEHDRAIAAYEAAHRLDPATPHGRSELADLRRLNPGPVPVDLHLAAPAEPAPDHAAATGPLAEALRTARLDDACLALFDPFFYHQANPAVRAAVPQPDRLACLRHFCATGLDQLLPFSSGTRFDADFYRDNYLHHLAFTPANAYRHWLNTGIRQGAAPNRQAWVQARLGPTVSSLDAVDLARVAARRGTELPSTWIARAEAFMASAGDPDPGFALDAQSAIVFAALADRLEEAGGENQDRVHRLRQLIAAVQPDLPGNTVRLAEVMLRRGSFIEAARLFRSLPRHAESPGTLLGLALCEENLGRVDQALQTLIRACAAFPDSEGLRSERSALSQRLFGQAWERGMAYARLGRIVDGQAELSRACDAMVAAARTTGQPPAPRAIRRVALAGHAPLPQCAFYRIDQTAELLRLAGYETEIFDLAEDSKPFHAALHGLDAVIFCRVPALPHVIAAIEAARAFGLVTYYDMDDLIFDAAYPDPLESYGGLLSRDGHAGLALAVPLFDHAMRLCTYGIASTQSLAAAMRTRVSSGQAFVRPNALGQRHLDFAGHARPGEPAATGAVTLFYGSGGKAHKADFAALVEPALVATVRKYGARVHILLMGEFPETDALRAIAPNLTILPAIWDLDAYWSVLAQVDINLAVLLPGPATDAKSEIKWLEAAMLGIPSVVSDTAAYRDVVRPDETGIICATTADWTAALDRLVGDATLRHRIGAQARTQALARYTPATIADTLHHAMQAPTPPGLRPPATSPPASRPLIVVAHVFYPPQAVGGATRVVADNIRDIRAIAGDRLDIEVFACLDGGNPYQVTSDAHDGIRVTRVGSPQVDALEYRAADERMGAIFGEYLDRTRPALVHFHCIQRLTASIVTAAAARSIPYIVTVHDGWWISEHQFLLDACGQFQAYDMARPIDTLQRQGADAFARATVLRRALVGAHRVLAVSEPFAALYRACGVPNVITVENGVPDLPPATARLPHPHGKVRLGFIGGLARHKGYDLVHIALMARPWRNLAILLIDHALPQGSVRHETWGTVPVEFRPKWPQAEVADLYARIDVLLAPSLWPESYGLVTREAVAAGCYVIASDRGSVADCVQDGISGFVIDVASPDGLIAALARIDADPARFQQPPPPPPPMRTARDQAQDIAALYDTILRDHPPRGATADLNIAARRPISLLGNQGSSATDG